MFYQDDQQIWIGSKKGLFVLEKGRLRKVNTSPELTNMDISAITKTKDGIVWIGTYGNGLFKLYDEKIIHYAYNDLELGQIFSVLKLKKTLLNFSSPLTRDYIF